MSVYKRTKQSIRAVHLPELSDGSCTSIVVDSNPVARIEREYESMGTYSVIWFRAYSSDGDVIKDFNAAHVAEIVYFMPGEKS